MRDITRESNKTGLIDLSTKRIHEGYLPVRDVSEKHDIAMWKPVVFIFGKLRILAQLNRDSN